MKTSLVILLIVGFVLVPLGSAIPVNAAIFSGRAAKQPWMVQLFKDDEGGVRNLSTAFVGKFQTPMLSYSRNGFHTIYLAHSATAAVPGNCGPNSSWHCSQWLYVNLVAGTVSPMAIMQKADTHLLQFAFSTGNMIRGATIELKNDMSFFAESQEDLLQLNKFGGTLIGTPSIQLVDGNYRMVVTISDNTDLYGYKLVYMQYASSSNTSCLDGGSHYQCEVIEQSYGFDSMGAPSLQAKPGGSVGIAYYRSGAGLKYAYPHISSPNVPSNCGTNGNTWRCISIFADAGTSTVGKIVKLAFGTQESDIFIAFTFGNSSFGQYLFRTEYVDSGGNCGADLNIYGVSVDKWKCNLMVFLGSSDPSFSIAIDPQGYPVIAYEYALTGNSPSNLYIGYPKARLGTADPGWVEQPIDGAPSALVHTGGQAAISLNATGQGFISYLQEEDYELTKLKFTWQQFQIFLPSIMR